MNSENMITFVAPQSMTPLQQKIYARLSELGIRYRRLECEPAVTIEDCRAVENRLGLPVVKTLFVANRQLTRFHLVVMPGDKPFVTRDFSRSLGVSRVSFVPADVMERMLQTPIGGCSPLCAEADVDRSVGVVIDEAVTGYDCVACPDSTTTNYLAIDTADIVNRYLPSCGHEPQIVAIETQE